MQPSYFTVLWVELSWMTMLLGSNPPVVILLVIESRFKPWQIAPYQLAFMSVLKW